MIKNTEQFLAGGAITIFMLMLFSLSYIAWSPQDLVGHVTGAACTAGKFQLTSTQGCIVRNGALFCPPTTSVQRCASTPQGNMLLQCLNGFCGEEIIKMSFEQTPPTDSSGARNNGACTSCPTEVSTGKLGKSAHFNGRQSVELPPFMPEQFTILLWAKPSSSLSIGKGVLISTRDSFVAEGFELSVNGPTATLFTGNPGSIVVSTQDGTDEKNLFTSSTVLRFDDWNHIAVVVDRIVGSARLYHNGVELLSAAAHQQLRATAWRIGSYTSGAYGFVGEIDELRIVQRMLSSAEIQADLVRAVQCGNRILEATEQCDDGNRENGDDCINSCEVAFCRDGVRKTSGTAPFESCDDGNQNNNDACLNNCEAARCGDNVIHAGHEVCDDGNQLNNDACDNCNLAVCGDGILRTQGVNPEQCDDHNTVNTDACAFCKDAVCGDGFVHAGFETCDDRNTIPNDGCSAQCITETCTDGIQNNGETAVDCGGSCAACAITPSPTPSPSPSPQATQCFTDSDCASGNKCMNGACVASSSPFCIDNDGGARPYLKQTTFMSDSRILSSDFCSDFEYFNRNQKTALTHGSLLYEQVCINGQQTEIVFACSCMAGRCSDITSGTPAGTCTNTDGLQRDQSSVLGTARASDGVWYSDYCIWDSSAGVFPSDKNPLLNKIREFSCGTNGITSTFISCANGCRAGACCPSTGCLIPTQSAGCGDGTVQTTFGEQCDSPGSTCSNGAQCTINCKCPTTTCTDSDNGINTKVKSQVVSSGVTRSDYCIALSAYDSGTTLAPASTNGAALVELACGSTGGFTTQVVLCNCQDGKCV